MSQTTAQKRARFAELHRAPGCFVMPNPFDVGSAKYLASLGFPALAGTSAGVAFSAGFARDAEGVHESARLCIGAGVAGFSIEDFTGDPAAPLYGLGEAVERLRAARAAINESGETGLLTARSEAILRQGGGGGA